MFSLFTANAIGLALVLFQSVENEWSRNFKFAIISISLLPIVIAAYNINVFPHDDRRIMSFGLSATLLGFLAIIGTLFLH